MLIVVTCFVKFLKNTLDFKDVAKMLPKCCQKCCIFGKRLRVYTLHNSKKAVTAD